MKRNVGGADKIVRIIIGVAIIAIGFIYNSVFGAIGLIPLLTGIIGWCPLYVLFKIDSTCENDSCEE